MSNIQSHRIGGYTIVCDQYGTFIFMDVGIVRIKLDYQYLLNRETINLRHVME